MLSRPLTDKLAEFEWSNAQGLPFTPTVAANDECAPALCAKWQSELDSALLAKPRAGNGSRGTGLLLDDSSLEMIFDDTSMVLQRYLADADPYKELLRQSATGLPFT